MFKWFTTWLCIVSLDYSCKCHARYYRYIQLHLYSLLKIVYVSECQNFDVAKRLYDLFYIIYMYSEN